VRELASQFGQFGNFSYAVDVDYESDPGTRPNNHLNRLEIYTQAKYQLGLQDSIWALVVVYPSFTIPFSIWLLMGFFKSIPKELEDAAMVDGLTRFGAFIKLVVPMSTSGILTVVIFTFTLVTQEFVYALTFISPEAHQMLGVGVPTFLILGDVYFWGSLMGGCLIASVPIALVYNLFLDRFIAGFTVGAVK